MAEREKVIPGFEHCVKNECEGCPWKSEAWKREGRAACEGFDKDAIEMPNNLAKCVLSLLKAQEPDESKYEYHTDHTDCPWYISGEESKCPVTCSQYRDGWNDAMDYIYKGGNGYRPYKRR